MPSGVDCLAAKCVCADKTTPPPLLGDRIEATLTKYGITKEAYRKWKADHGFSDECNCDERQELLNRLDRWARSLVGR